MRTEITERRATINTLPHETKDVVQDDDESGTMDWFTKVFVSLKVGTDWFTGLLAPPVILNGTPPAWRGLYSERSKMHSGKGRHEVESAHKGKIVEDVVPELAPVPRRTIKPL